MGGSDISEGAKIGISVLLACIVLGIGINIYIAARRTYVKQQDRQTAVITSSDYQTWLELTDNRDINGATLYTALSQYGEGVAGFVYEEATIAKDGTVTTTTSQVIFGELGNSVDELMGKIASNGFKTNYRLYRSDSVGSVTATQSIFVLIQKVTEL